MEIDMASGVVKPHLFVPDPNAPADWRGFQPCTCGLPSINLVHELPDTSEWQAEHLRRIGEDDE